MDVDEGHNCPDLSNKLFKLCPAILRVVHLKNYIRNLMGLPKTLTYDQGTEMSGHKQFTVDTGIQVYFAHPGQPWERGTNENTNGLIRQYFPKGIDFSTVSVRQLKRVQRQLNDRPRAVLNYKKPDEVINQLIGLKV